MAKIKLASNFEVFPEGTYVFKIVDVRYKPEWNKVEIEMVTQDGKKFSKNYIIATKDGKTAPSFWGFTYLARAALNNPDLDEISPEELIGHFVECTMEHNMKESTTNPGKMNTYSNIVKSEPAEGWDEPIVKKSPMNLAALLG